MNLPTLSRTELEQLLRHPDMGDVMKEKIQELLGQAPESKAVVTSIARTLELTLPWSCLAPDNLRKGVAGKENREKQGRYSEALARARARLRDLYDGGPMRGPLRMTAAFYMPDDRPRDPTNFLKCLLDALKEIVIVDDRWQELRDVRVITRGIDCDAPRVELVVGPC